MIFHDWVSTEIIPSPDAWYQYQVGGSADHIIYDTSGNERNLVGDSSNAPVLTTNVHEGYPAWYFDGTREPLVYSGAFTVKHAFVLASNEDATFDGYQGLLTGETLGDVLVGDDTTTKFFNLGISNIYTSGGTAYTEADQQAPMSGTFRLMEVKNSTGITLDGIQVGQQKADVTRRWQGHFVEMILFSRVLTAIELRRVRLYFNIKFGEWKRGVPFYFPDATITPTIGPSRFYPAPPDWKQITDTWEYEDGGKDFNEVASSTPLRFEYSYPAVPKAHLPIYDEFNNQARLVNAFYFRDPDDLVWSTVRIEDYNRNHEAHKRWKHDVAFVLAGYNPTPTPDDTTPALPAVPTGLALFPDTSTTLLATWDGPADTTAPSVPSMSAASGITNDVINWNWTAATDDTAVDGYVLQVAEDAGFSTGLRTIPLGDVLTYGDSGLTGSTIYYARVRAFDAAGNYSAYSSSVNATTDADPTPLLLDTLGLTAKLAYGLRKLRTAYSGACLRVRRASDNAEQDIGFVSDVIDWASAITFKGGSSLTVVLWYDQSGSNKNFDALADSREPVLDTSLELINFDGSDDLFRAASVDLSGTAAISVLWAGKYDALTTGTRAYTVGTANPRFEFYTDGSLFIAQIDGANNKNNAGDTTARVFTSIIDRSLSGAAENEFYLNSTAASTTGDSTNNTGNFASCDIGMAENAGSNIADITTYEFILFASAISSGNRATAVADIRTFYGI